MSKIEYVGRKAFYVGKRLVAYDDDRSSCNISSSSSSIQSIAYLKYVLN